LTIYLLDDAFVFPDPTQTDDPSGILAVGGDLTPGRLVLAYSLGIFPWYDAAFSPILWHCPEERFVLKPHELRVGRSIRRSIRDLDVVITYDQAFTEVIGHCGQVPRHGQDGTWLNEEMKSAYMELNQQDYAHSAEAWQDGKLIGGLYGVTLGGVFFGESMFSLIPGASKAIFAALVPRLERAGYRLIDCQIYTEHLARFGAVEWPREQFLSTLKKELMVRPRPKWPSNT
jgi:leucyl/phenylalanyl-tRNA--protein transferase